MEIAYKLGPKLLKRMNMKTNLKHIVLVSALVIAACTHKNESPNVNGEKQTNVKEVQPLADDQKNVDAESDMGLYMTPNVNGHVDFIKLVDAAKTEIKLAMFRITNKPVADSLIAAKNRNVKVQIIVDRNASAPANSQAIKKQLEDAGVEIKFSTTGFSITHEKAMSIDGEKLLISSINLTNAVAVTRGFAVVSVDKAAIADFNSVFDADWSNADSGGNVTPSFKGDKIFFSPIGSEDRLVNFIGQAQKSVTLYVENFTDKRVAEALIDASNRSVQVQVLVPLCTESRENPTINHPIVKDILSRSKVQAKMMPQEKTLDTPYIHTKAIVIDGEKFYLGSMNFSYNSLTKAREVGIILENHSVSSEIKNTFDKDWSHAVDVPQDSAGACVAPAAG